MRSRPRTYAIVLGVVAGSLGGVAPASASNGVVQPGESIQAAIDHAGPGDTIRVAPGEFRENLTITTDGITLRGAGSGRHGTLLTPASPPKPSECTDPSPDVNGICVDEANDVTVKDLTVAGFPSTGIYAYEAEDFTVARVRARDNQGYGIAGFELSGVRYLDSVATGNDAPGIYVGDSPDAQAVIRGNTAISNGVGGEGFGFLFRDSNHGLVVGNHASGNCVGFHFLDHVFGDPAAPLSDWTAKGNTATRNNGACPAVPDIFPAFSGTGILLFGANEVRVTRNFVIGNRPSAPSEYAGGIVLATSVFLGGAEPSDNVVSRNVALFNEPDIRWDETGTGNRFRRNLCATSLPGWICDR
jgi:hypothetical protein